MSADKKIQTLITLISKRLNKESVPLEDIVVVVEYHKQKIQNRFELGEFPRDLVREYSRMVQPAEKPL